MRRLCIRIASGVDRGLFWVDFSLITVSSLLMEVGESESHELLNSSWMGPSGSQDPHGVQGHHIQAHSSRKRRVHTSRSEHSHSAYEMEIHCRIGNTVTELARLGSPTSPPPASCVPAAGHFDFVSIKTPYLETLSGKCPRCRLKCCRASSD